MSELKANAYLLGIYGCGDIGWNTYTYITISSKIICYYCLYYIIRVYNIIYPKILLNIYVMDPLKPIGYYF